MKKALFLPLLLLATAMPVYAQEAEEGGSGIVALVNDEVISSLDVSSRLAFVLATTQLSDTPEVRERLKPQLLRSLLDEKLQLQEATRAGIEVTDRDVQAAIAGMEQQRGIPPGGMLERLDVLGVPKATFLDQLHAQLAWNKLVVRTLRSQVKISDDEIDRERSKVRRSTGTKEVEIEVLALPVDRPENDAQVKALAGKLAAEIRAGAPFESVARALGGTQAQDIKPFWAAVDQLDPALAGALEQAQEGAITEPVRTLEGYTLAKLVGRRAGQAVAGNYTEVVLKDILLKLKEDASPADAELMLSIGKEVARHPGNCSDTGIAGVKNLGDFDIGVQYQRETLEGLPEQLRGIVARLNVGGVSEPYASEDGIRLFMLCERVEKPGELENGEVVAQRLFQQKLELEAQKYLRNLRREATIDVRRQ